MSKKTLHKKKIKKTVRRYKAKKSNKKTVKNGIRKNIFTKKEKIKIDKILNELEKDMNYILEGSKAQVKNKKKKFKKDIIFLSGNKMGDQSGGGWEKNAGYAAGFAVMAYLGCDAFMDHGAFTDFFGHIGLGNLLDPGKAATIFTMIIRVASRPLFRSFSNKAMAHLGCDRYVKQQSMTQEECNAKNISLYEMGESIMSLQLPLTMATTVYMMS
tara:strand:- start:323 stop:964 length:642 start_codon:yes stop_codon:yes gene_type:complete